MGATILNADSSFLSLLFDTDENVPVCQLSHTGDGSSRIGAAACQWAGVPPSEHGQGGGLGVA